LHEGDLCACVWVNYLRLLDEVGSRDVNPLHVSGTCKLGLVLGLGVRVRFRVNVGSCKLGLVLGLGVRVRFRVSVGSSLAALT
jgi:hypothetical protein